MLRWADNGKAECSECGFQWTPVSEVLPNSCRGCERLEPRASGPRQLAVLRKTITTLIIREQIDALGMQTRIAEHFSISRQRVSQVVKEQREALSAPEEAHADA